MLLIQRDVSDQTKLELLLSRMTEDQLQMLSQVGCCIYNYQVLLRHRDVSNHLPECCTLECAARSLRVKQFERV